MRLCLSCRRLSGDGPICTSCQCSFGGRLCKSKGRHLNPPTAQYCGQCGTSDLMHAAHSIPFGWATRLLLWGTVLGLVSWLGPAACRGAVILFIVLTGYWNPLGWLLDKALVLLAMFVVLYVLAALIPGPLGKVLCVALAKGAGATLGVFFSFAQKAVLLIFRGTVHLVQGRSAGNASGNSSPASVEERMAHVLAFALVAMAPLALVSALTPSGPTSPPPNASTSVASGQSTASGPPSSSATSPAQSATQPSDGPQSSGAPQPSDMPNSEATPNGAQETPSPQRTPNPTVISRSIPSPAVSPVHRAPQPQEEQPQASRPERDHRDVRTDSGSEWKRVGLAKRSPARSNSTGEQTRSRRTVHRHTGDEPGLPPADRLPQRHSPSGVEKEPGLPPSDRFPAQDQEPGLPPPD